LTVQLVLLSGRVVLVGKLLKVLLLIAILLTFAAGGLLLLASKTDIGAATVVSEIEKAARQHLNADLSVSSVSGNPIRGFTINGLSLSRNGFKIFSSAETHISFKLPSLATGSPRIRSVSFGGALLNWAEIAPLLSLEGTGGPLALPFDLFRVHKSIVQTHAGSIRIEEGRVAIKDQAIDASGSLLFRDIPFTFSTEMWIGEERLDLKDLDVKGAGGKMTASGRLLPVADLKGRISGLDIGMLEKFWPDLAHHGYSGEFSTIFAAGGPWPDIKVEGELEIPKGVVYGIEVEKIGSPWTFSGNALEITGLEGVANGTEVSGKIQFVFSEMPPVTTIDMKAKRAELDSWRGSFPWLSIADGTIDSAEIRLQGTSNSLSGSISLDSSSFSLAKQPFSGIRSVLALENSSKIGLDVKATWLDSPVSGKGDITLAQKPLFDITLSGKDLNLGEAATLIPVENLDLSGRASGSVRISGSGNDVRSEGALWSERITAAGETVDKPDLKFSYVKGTITLQSMTALWRGTRVSGSGTIAGLDTGKGSFDLSGRIEEGPVSSMAGFVPALKDLGLQGRSSAGWSLKGPIKNPMLALEIRSPLVEAPGQARLTEMKILTKLALPPGKDMPDMRLDMAAERLDLNDFSLTGLRTALTVSSGNLNIENAQGQFLGAEISLSGSARLPSGNRPASLDLKGEATEVDLSVLEGGVPFNVKGPVKTRFALKGDLPDPEITISGNSPWIVLAGLHLSDLSFSAKGNTSSLTVEEFKGSAGEGSLSATGEISSDGGALTMDLNLEGSNLDLAQITKDIQGNGSLDLSGTVDASMRASLRDGKWEGKGELFSNSLTAFGLNFNDASIPVFLQEGSARAENAQGKFYGGNITADASFEASTGRWNIRASAAGVALEPAIRAAVDLEGQISGKADLDMTLSGAYGRHVLTTGRGNLVATDGEISGFKALRAISSAYGMSSIRYRMIDANFKVDGNVITLLPGSRATAQPEDPLYRYLTVDGPAGPGGNLNLYCSGLVNVQALNTLLGAIQGLATAGASSPEALIEGLIGGVVGGLGRQDFRDTSFRIGGTWGNPSFSSFRIAPAPGSVQPAPQAGGVGQTTQNDSQHRITITIPTGEGHEKPDDTGDQIKQQVIEQLLRNIIPGK
jgi:translocation and assembly module TamB